jgi:hypothetical protein
MGACLNCGAALVGPFCHACGQRDEPRVRPVRELLADAADDLLSWDSRLLRTARGLARPGFLTREHLAGRRVHYVPPLRLYLLVSALNLALAATLGDRRHFFFFSAQPGEGNERVISYLPRVMFVLVPGFAALLALVFRRPRRMFAEHFVFALHFHAATFLLACANFVLVSPQAGIPAALAPVARGAAQLLGVGGVVYLFLALRTVYGRGRAATALSMAALLAGYVALLFLGLWATISFVAGRLVG